jgi:hypothetical protein
MLELTRIMLTLRLLQLQLFGHDYMRTQATMMRATAVDAAATNVRKKLNVMILEEEYQL